MRSPVEKRPGEEPGEEQEHILDVETGRSRTLGSLTHSFQDEWEPFLVRL